MKQLMSKKVLMGAGLVLVAYLLYKAYKKKPMSEQKEFKASESNTIESKAKPAQTEQPLQTAV